LCIYIHLDIGSV